MNHKANLEANLNQFSIREIRAT